MTYQCKIDIFEGPLDLLLHLIREQKMQIHDIPIAKITQQYIDYLNLMKELDLEIVGDYLVMAAELTRIKSKTLLPVQETEEEDGEAGVDPRAELTRRLLEYQRYKEAAFELRQREYDRQQVFIRGTELELEDEEGTETMVEASVFDLLQAFQGVLKNNSYKKDYEIHVSTYSVSDRISYILEIINASESITFESLFTVLNSRQEVIVTFLALLELMRLNLLRIQQSNQFGAIRIYQAANQEIQNEVLKDYQGSWDEENTSVEDKDTSAS
jgi:segregation and condensation protein A